ncbi:MAG: hypothetical protein QF767_10500, partial [Alphaproteobacteria bacterium]|nr:hypothetical protein [Alphaproteobacteria bacterium]
MKVLVGIKRTIDANVKVRVKADESGVETANVKMTINPFCEIAAEEAVRMKEAGIAEEVVVVTAGPEEARQTLMTALAIGAEKMSNDDRTKPIKALEAAADLDELEALKARISPDGAGTGSVFMDLYSSVARDYMAASGATAEDFARVSVKQRHAGALNPIAQFRADVDVEEVLASRMIADPITLLMCSSIGDGAAALVVMSEQAAAKRDIQPVEILACEIRSGQGDDPEAAPVATAASRAAYQAAGLGPEDLSVVELHDAA